MTRPRTIRWGSTLLAGGLFWCAGCVQRTISINSEPAGALVWVNDREIGRTPVEFEFLYYGDYAVRLEREGFEPLSTVGKAKPPWWETVGVDLLAELIPLPLHSRVEWQYDLAPLGGDSEMLQERAREIRDMISSSDAD